MDVSDSVPKEMISLPREGLNHMAPSLPAAKERRGGGRVTSAHGKGCGPERQVDEARLAPEALADKPRHAPWQPCCSHPPAHLSS